MQDAISATFSRCWAYVMVSSATIVADVPKHKTEPEAKALIRRIKKDTSLPCIPRYVCNSSNTRK